MEKLKRAAAAATVAVMTAAAFSGCSLSDLTPGSATDYCMTANGEEVKAGVYISYLLSEMTNQMYTLYYQGEVTSMSDCFDKQIDDKDFKTYCKDEALDNTKKHAVINAKFDELKLELSDEDKDSVDSSVSSAWEDSAFYEYEGISKQSLRETVELSYKQEAIFDYYYDADGEEGVSDDTVSSYVNDNYMRYKSISVAKSTSDDEDTADAENEELKALVDGYLTEAQELSFEEFDTIIDEYAAYQEEQSAEEEEETDSTDSTDSTVENATTELDSSAADTTDSTVETEAVAEDAADDSESTDETADTDETAEYTLSSDSTGDTSSTDSTADTEEEEEDPYANETVLNYTDATDSESDSYDEDYASMLTEFKSADYNTPAIYETDDYYYLYVTADIAERTDYPTDNRDTLVHEMKDDEFDEKITTWTDDMKFVVNNKAIKKYTVQEIYDRQEKYYSE